MGAKLRFIRYCDDEKAVLRELECARKVSPAVRILFDALNSSKHHPALECLGQALIAARRSHAYLEAHCEYYVAIPTTEQADRHAEGQEE